MRKDFDKAFDDFIDRREYDQAENALFSMIRIAFKAGWLAAGGRPPKARKVLELKRATKTVVLEIHPDYIETDIRVGNT